LAIYSLNHKHIGRSTHEAGTAGAHLAYITRASACTFVLGKHLPLPYPGYVEQARVWMDKQEDSDRKNARVVDKFTLALPIELDYEQRNALVERFAERLTRGQTPWLAAIHAKGKDVDNPHCHFVLRDRHIETGKRAIGMSEKGSTDRVRLLWEQVANEALEEAGSDARIDRRSLKDQGITDRDPQKHIGPIAKAIEDDGRDSWKLEAIREEKLASDRRRDARSVSESAQQAPKTANSPVEPSEGLRGASERPQEPQDAFDADQARIDAAKAQTAAERSLSRARQNLQNAQDILEGKADLVTGKRKPTGERFTLPERSDSDLSEEAAAHEEYLANWCDEDGDEVFPAPRPYPTDYEDTKKGQQAFADHLAEWEAGEAIRISRAERNKRRIWEREFPRKRKQLREITRLNPVQIIGDTLQLARSIFDWMRERVVLARNILGEKHDLTKQMKADWGEALVENKMTHELVRRDHEEGTHQADASAQSIWDRSEKAWVEVEAKREAHKTGQYAHRRPTDNNGPKM